MARPAEWAKKGKEQVPQQRSFLRRIPASMLGGGTQASAGAGGGYVPPTLSAPASFPSRMTGNGVDGVMQPGKFAGQVEEGEGVFNRNAMQNLTSDEFTAFSKAAQDGTLNKNLFRQSIGMPTMQSYNTGGIVRRSSGVPEDAEEVSDNQPVSQSSTATITQTAPTFQAPQNKVPAPVAVTAPPVITQTAPTFQAPQNKIPAPVAMTAPPVITQTAPIVQATQNKAPTLQTTVQDRTGYHQELDSTGTQIWVKDTPAATTVPSTTSTEGSAVDLVKQGLQNIKDQMSGMTAADQNILNYIMGKFTASGAADMRVLEHEISANPDLSDQAKRNAIAAAQREQSAQKYTLAGDFAATAAENARTAATNAVTLGQQVKAYEQITLPAAKQNMDIIQRTFDEITLPTGKVNLEQMKTNLGQSNWNDIQGMIDKGFSMETVNAELSKKGMAPLSTAEFASVLNAGALGERNWNRKLTAANMLLNTPGETNKTAAAALYSNIFPGVDFDFSELVSQENSERFSTGLSQMASYVATNADFDEVITAMKKDGTLDMMGMDESQAAQLYNSMRVNSIDAQWEEYSNSDFFNNTMSETERADALEFFKAKTLGNLDYDTLHEYEIYDGAGNLTKTIYATDASEAGKAASKAGTGYTFKDTGKVKFQMASTIDATTTATSDTPVTPSLEGSGTERAVGEVFVEGGRLYQVDSGHKVSEVKVDPAADAWSTIGDNVIKMGATDNPFYTKIMDERSKSIIDGTHEIKNKIDDPATYDYTLSKTSATDLSPTIVTKSGDSKTLETINFGSVPKSGSVINYDGALFKVTSEVKSQKAAMGRNGGNYIEVVNLQDGRSAKIFASGYLDTAKATADGLTSADSEYYGIKYLVPKTIIDYSTT